MIKNYLSHFLPVLLALDLIIPFLLAPFYKDYNHLTQVMSVLGNSKAPLHSIYNIWLVAFGVAIFPAALSEKNPVPHPILSVAEGTSVNLTYNNFVEYTVDVLNDDLPVFFCF